MYVGHTKRRVQKWKFLQHALSRYVYNRSLLDTIIIIIIIIVLLLLLLLLLILQVKPEITIYNYISHKKVDIRQRNKMMVEKSSF